MDLWWKLGTKSGWGKEWPSPVLTVLLFNSWLCHAHSFHPFLKRCLPLPLGSPSPGNSLDRPEQVWTGALTNALTGQNSPFPVYWWPTALPTENTLLFQASLPPSVYPSLPWGFSGLSHPGLSLDRTVVSKTRSDRCFSISGIKKSTYLVFKLNRQPPLLDLLICGISADKKTDNVNNPRTLG